MNTCPDCRHVIVAKPLYCGHPDAGIHPVDGKRHPEPIYCADARYGADQWRWMRVCGLEGRLWEAKAP